jgi:CRISPR-associated protein Csm3
VVNSFKEEKMNTKTNNTKLIKKIFINGTIEAITGLSIGGSSVGLAIGGADKVVVRNPLNNQPYIPGSSLKGKMRSLLEKIDEKLTEKKDKNDKVEGYGPCECGDCLICKVFGVPAEKGKPLGRLIVRDTELTKESEQLLNESKNTDMPYTEVKTEVVIDRITSSATPRNFERVPAGAKFNLRLICNIFEGDDEKEIIEKVLQGLKLVQDDYLGGSGTRGYGEVKFRIEKITFKDKDAYENGTEAKELTGISIPQELL